MSEETTVTITVTCEHCGKETRQTMTAETARQWADAIRAAADNVKPTTIKGAGQG
jgi:hypothetical protein